MTKFVDLNNKMRSYIIEGEKRSVNAKKNILQMLVYKGGHILIGLILVPLTINYVNATNYGIWLTLSSMVAWFHFFDVGINSGLRNKLTEAIASNNIIQAKKYVSSTYAFLTIVFVPLMIFGLAIVPFINLYSLLNISQEACPELLLCTKILIGYFCINFILSTINVIFLAYQDPAGSSFRTFIQQITTLIVIYLLTKTTTGSLTNLCLALCAVPIIILFYFNVSLFKGRYKEISPSPKAVDFHVVPGLLKLGVQFFIIQLAGIIQYQMVNFIIIRYYGATDVSAYNIAYRYFNILTMIWGIMTTPLWSAVTDAKAKGEYLWIMNAQRKYLKASCMFFFVGIIMVICSPFVYKIWIGDAVEISFVLSVFVFLLSILMMFGSIYVTVLNGLSELKIQFYACMFSPIIFIVCCYLFIKVMHMGVYSIVLAGIVANYNGVILAPIQCHSLLKKYNK